MKILLVSETPTKTVKNKKGVHRPSGSYLSVARTERMLKDLGYDVHVLLVAGTGRVVLNSELDASLIGFFEDTDVKRARMAIVGHLRKEDYDGVILMLRRRLCTSLFTNEPSILPVIEEKREKSGKPAHTFIVCGLTAANDIEEVVGALPKHVLVLERPGVSRITCTGRELIIETLQSITQQID